MLIQKPKAVSLESPVVSCSLQSLFHINKVDFPGHYRLRVELARTMREAEAVRHKLTVSSAWGSSGPSAAPQSCWCSVMALYNFAGGSLTQLLFITGDIYTIILSPSSHCTDYIQGNCLPLNIDLIDQNLGMQRKISFKTHSPQSTVHSYSKQTNFKF